jgi:hypothetical protein
MPGCDSSRTPGPHAPRGCNTEPGTEAFLAEATAPHARRPFAVRPRCALAPGSPRRRHQAPPICPKITNARLTPPWTRSGQTPRLRAVSRRLRHVRQPEAAGRTGDPVPQRAWHLFGFPEPSSAAGAGVGLTEARPRRGISPTDLGRSGECRIMRSVRATRVTVGPRLASDPVCRC